MKHFFLSFILFASACYVAAQPQKGSKLLGGTLGINNISEGGSSITLINVSPRVGFFLSRRFALGGGLNLNVAVDDGYTEGSIGLFPFARVYFNTGGMSRFFTQLDIGAQIPDVENVEGAPPMLAGLSFGADFFLNENVAIEAALGYQRVQDLDIDIGLDLIGLNVGVVALIGGHKE